MKRVAAIIGRPGAGKSTVVRAFMDKVGASGVPMELGSPLLKGHLSPGITILGDYSDPDEIFPGTDRLSMAVAPVALAWIKQASCDVLFEGDRLGNAKTLRMLSLQPGVRLRIWCLQASEFDLTRRYMMRGSAQSARVLQARATKVANICANPNFIVNKRSNRTEDQFQAIVEELNTFFEERVT